MPQAVRGEPRVGLHQRSPIGMAIEVLPEGVPAGFEVLGVQDPNRQLDQPAAKMNDGWLDAHVHIQMPSGQRLLDVDGLQKTLQGLCQWRVDSVFLRR